ncbi:MAG: tetratricopeptide repeat protein [Planctomycetota bacterium]|nr:tetratricopeptide repeat protein [Planctomycetota bacterium]
MHRLESVQLLRGRAFQTLVWSLLASALGGCSWSAQNANTTGVQMFQQGQYQAADTQFRNALAADPNNADAYYNLGANYHRQWKTSGRPDDLHQAESNYQQCLARNPQHTDCYRGMSVLLIEQGRAVDAFALMDRWYQLNPSNPQPQIELARMYEEFGEPENAQKRLVDALALDPTNSRAMAALGRIREQSGDTAQALANYQRSLSVNPNQPQVTARVAALQSGAISAPGMPAPANGQRWVATPNTVTR